MGGAKPLPSVDDARSRACRIRRVGFTIPVENSPCIQPRVLGATRLDGMLALNAPGVFVHSDYPCGRHRHAGEGLPRKNAEQEEVLQTGASASDTLR
jgi:hypothetical protein